MAAGSHSSSAVRPCVEPDPTLESCRRWQAWAWFACTFAALLSQPHAASAADPLSYQDRGNRLEGFRPQEVSAPSFEALSFVRGPRMGEISTRVLNLHFQVPDAAALSITARELIPVKYYEMRVRREDWPAGRNTFGPWDTAEVIEPLKVQRSNIGVLGRFTADGGGSGRIVAVAFDEESRSQRYEFQFRTKYDLKLASYRVLEADSSAEVLQGTLSDVTGGAPASIAFDLSSAGEGWYVLVVDCLYKGRSGGPQRSFRFYRAD